jgi:hypothetical protein
VDLAGGGALDRAENVDFNRKFRTISKMNGVEQRSPDLGGAVRSLHYFEYATLYGETEREVLALEGGDLHRINSTVSSNVVTGGSGAFIDEHLSTATFNDRIHFASKHNDPKKYDGAALRKWGVDAPGSNPTEQVTFDSATGWTPSAGNAVAISTVIHKRGTGSLGIFKVNTAGANCSALNTGLSITTGATVGMAYIWVYVDNATYDVLSVASCLRVQMGDALFADASEFFFDKWDLFPGWNLLPLDNATAVFSGAGAPNPSVALQVLFTTANATDTGFIAVDYLYNTPVGNLTAAVGAAGALTGAFRYKVTYVTKYGVESNAGPASNSVTLAAQRGSLTAIPVSPDTQVIARRIYRDVGASSVFGFIHEIQNNTSTTYTDNNATAGSTLPPEAASATNDASPPERMTCVCAWRNHIFGINAANQIQLDVTNGGDPETWPLVASLTFQESITALAVHPSGLLVFTADKTYVMSGYGTTADPFLATEVNAEVGANHWLSVATTRDGVVTHHEGRLYLMSASSNREGGVDNPWLLNARMLRSDQSLWRPSIVVADRVRDRILLAMPTAPGDTDYNAIQAINFTSVGISQVTGDGPGINPQDIRLGVHSTILNPFSAFQSFAIVENDNEEAELWAALEDGYVVCMANQAGDNGYYWQSAGATATLTTVLAFMVPLHAQPGGRGDVRYFEVDAEGATGAVWATSITYYDSPMRTTSLGGPASFNVDGTKSTVTAIPSGARGAIAYITMTNTTAYRSTISRIRCHVIPRFAPRGVRT